MVVGFSEKLLTARQKRSAGQAGCAEKRDVGWGFATLISELFI
jgi:hypothetical protein